MSTGFVNGEWNIGAAVYKTGDRMATYRNGSLVASRAANGANLPAGLALDIGRNDIGGYYLQADVAEILIYNRALSDSERMGVENYLNAKYAVVAPPPAPAALTASAISPTQTSLLWDASSNALGYSVERKAGATGTFTAVAAIAGGEVDAYLDTGLTPAETYTYRVRAENAQGDSPYSNEVSVTLSVAGASNTLPTDDLQFWLRADAGVTHDASGNVTVWSDVSGHGNNAFVSSGNTPVWMPAAVNGQPVLRFDGVSSFLQLPSGFSDFTQGLTALLVVKPSTVAYYSRIFDLANGAGQQNLLLARLGTTDGLGFYSQNTQFEVDTITGLTLNQYELLEITQDPVARLATIFRNGLSLGNTTAGAITNVQRTSNFIGRGNDNVPYFAGDIAEVILFNRALTDAERDLWQRYLNAKYQYNPVPPTPSQVHVVPLSNSQVEILWDEAGAPVTGYMVERQNADGSWSAVATVAGNSTSYVDESLTPSTTYSYRVTASNAQGNSPVSAAASATTGVNNAGPGVFPTGAVQLWLQADAGVNTDPDGLINQWSDESGHGFSATPSNGNQPSFVANAIHGRSVVRFDGSSSFLSLPNSSMSGLGAAEVFVVLRAADPTAGVPRGFWRFNDASIAEYPWSDGNIYDTFGTDSQYSFSPTATPLNQFNLYNVSAAPGAWAARLNWKVLSSTTNNSVNFSAGAYTLGRDRDGHLFAGDMAEVLIFNRTLSDDERLAVEQYFNGKYALTSALPVPSGLSADAVSSTQISLTWQYPAGNDAAHFTIKRAIAGSNNYQVIAVVGNVRNFLDTTVAAGTAYNYEIVATDAAGSISANSNAVPASTTLSGPAAGPWCTDLVMTYAADDLGHIQSQTVDPNGLNLVTRYSSDLNGNQLSVTDPRNSVTTFGYNARNQLRVCLGMKPDLVAGSKFSYEQATR